jgi:hypothetical protein
MYLPADSLGLTAQIATPISLPGGIAGPIVFGQSPAEVGHGRPRHWTDGTIEPFESARSSQPTATAAASCSAAVPFVDAAGAVIQSSTVSVQPGQSLPYDLVWSDSRAQIRAMAEVRPWVPPAGSAIPIALPCNLIPTLEFFDTNRGRTDLIIGVSHFVWVPPPLATTA